MHDYKKHVSTRSVGKRNSAGIGHVIIPIDEDRENYIRTVYNTGLIAIAVENGGTVENVLISKECIGNITFPDTNNSLGSLIFWVNIPKFNQPVAVCTLNRANELVSLGEGQFFVNKEDRDGFVEVSGDAKRGTIIIKASSKTEKGGEINLSVSNKSKTAKLNINVKGFVTLKCDNVVSLETAKGIDIKVFDPTIDTGITTIRYEKGVGLSYKDEFGHQIIVDKNTVQVIHKDGSKCVLSEGLIQFNEGEFGGLTKTKELQTQLNKTNQLLEAIVNIIKGAPIPETGSGAPSSFQSTLNSAIAALSLGNFDEIENTKITH